MATGCCWTHVRRRFVNRFKNVHSPTAEKMLRQIALLYQIEKAVRGNGAAIRLVVRREHAAPVVAAPGPCLEAQLSRIPQKSQLAEDIRYTLAHWPGLIVRQSLVLDDGILELDTNPVENQIRPIALTRKNALFAGKEVGAENGAMLASLAATCKMSGVNPVGCIADTLRAIPDGHPKSRIEKFMPGGRTLLSGLTAQGPAATLTDESV
ncbi:transposase [Paracoccus sp. MC1862]|uniref:IS66 family transposase n=1 Tax=Paracoccus sp. MC1862 TaxID=2760307 RepID=UPI0021133096|nr:transposase [Paracoccus sp. MC1862]